MEVEQEHTERKGQYDKVAVGLDLEKLTLEKDSDALQVTSGSDPYLPVHIPVLHADFLPSLYRSPSFHHAGGVSAGGVPVPPAQLHGGHGAGPAGAGGAGAQVETGGWKNAARLRLSQGPLCGMRPSIRPVYCGLGFTYLI